MNSDPINDVPGGPGAALGSMAELRAIAGANPAIQRLARRCENAVRRAYRMLSDEDERCAQLQQQVLDMAKANPGCEDLSHYAVKLRAEIAKRDRS